MISQQKSNLILEITTHFILPLYINLNKQIIIYVIIKLLKLQTGFMTKSNRSKNCGGGGTNMKSTGSVVPWNNFTGSGAPCVPVPWIYDSPCTVHAQIRALRCIYTWMRIYKLFWLFILEIGSLLILVIVIAIPIHTIEKNHNHLRNRNRSSSTNRRYKCTLRHNLNPK